MNFYKDKASASSRCPDSPLRLECLLCPCLCLESSLKWPWQHTTRELERWWEQGNAAGLGDSEQLSSGFPLSSSQTAFGRIFSASEKMPLREKWNRKTGLVLENEAETGFFEKHQLMLSETQWKHQVMLSVGELQAVKHPESSPPFLEVFGGLLGELSNLPFPFPRVRTPNVPQPYCPSWETILEKRGRRKNIEKIFFSQPLNSTFCYFILWDQVDLVVVVFVLFFSPWKGSVFILAGVFHLDYL